MRKFGYLLLLSLFASQAFSQQSDVNGANPPPPDEIFQVVPNAYANTPGTASFLSPLANNDRTYQMLINENQLTNLVGQELKSINLRLPANATSSWPDADITISNYDIYLSESVHPSQRSLTFADNIVGTQTQVRAGQLVIPANTYPSGSSPNDFGREIAFDTSWLYTGGHLLIEIRKTAFAGTSRSNDAIGTSTTGYLSDFSACWIGNYTGTVGLQGNFSVIEIKGDDPVPVELNSFTASVVGNNVDLKWITATETNNKGFEVYKAKIQSNKEVSENDWQKLGFIPGAGTSTEIRNYSFADEKVSAGVYLYRLKQIDYDGSFSYYDLSSEVEVTVPGEYSLSQNFPNPFNPSTAIKYSIAQEGFVNLTVYNTLGEKVVSLVNQFQQAGSYEINFNATDLTSGVYFYRLEAGEFSDIKRLMLIK